MIQSFILIKIAPRNLNLPPFFKICNLRGGLEGGPGPPSNKIFNVLKDDYVSEFHKLKRMLRGNILL